jgi:hypothetical protein
MLERSDTMKRLCMTAAILLLSGGLALAQAIGSATGPVGSGTTGPTNPSPARVPSDEVTVGRAPGVNPGNSKDLTNRSNPQDLTKPGGGNPQDLKR